MSDSDNKNQKLSASFKETAAKLRKLADELERGVVTINDQEHTLNPDTTAKISLKTGDNKLSCKLKINILNPTVDNKAKTEESDKSEINLSRHRVTEREHKASKDDKFEMFKDLKKRMSIDFKSIMKSCIKDKSIPEQSLAERFYRDSQAMCNYPDKGEEFYEYFLKHASRFYEAFKKSDLGGMSSAITTLDHMKNECHDKYK